MRTILIAHRDEAFAEQLTTEQAGPGITLLIAPDRGGQWSAASVATRAIVPITEAADLMIYDPELTALDSLGQRYNLAVDSAQAHPEVPMLLAWSPAEVPDACRDPSRDPGASTSGARCGARPSCPAAPDSGSARRGADAGNIPISVFIIVDDPEYIETERGRDNASRNGAMQIAVGFLEGGPAGRS